MKMHSGKQRESRPHFSAHSAKASETFTHSMSQKPVSSQSVLDEEEMLSLEQTPYDKVVEQRNK